MSLGYHCAFCLKGVQNYTRTFLLQGYICSNTYEKDYMDKFILPFNNFEHRCWAKWVQHLRPRSMNNFERFPSFIRIIFPLKSAYLTPLTWNLLRIGPFCLKTLKKPGKKDLDEDLCQKLPQTF